MPIRRMGCLIQQFNVSRLGYKNSFDKIELENDFSLEENDNHHYSWRDIHLDISNKILYKPKHLKLDLGGMAKGYTVDKAGYLLRKKGIY